MLKPPQRGRPEGREYPYGVTIRYGDREKDRLVQLSRKLERKPAMIWREALKRYAETEGLE